MPAPAPAQAPAAAPRTATMINPTTGAKQVVVAGSQQAHDLFGKGFYLMGAGGKAVGYTPPAGGAGPSAAPTQADLKQGLAPFNQPATGANRNLGITPAQAGPTGTPRTATLFGPGGEKKIVVAGSADAQGYLDRGWTLTGSESASKPKVTLVGPNGEQRTVYKGTGEESTLRNQGYGEKAGGQAVTTSTPARSAAAQGIEDITNTLSGGQEAPKAPSMVDTWKNYRTQYGIEGLQSKIGDVESRINNLDTSYQAGSHNIGNELGPMSVLGGRQRELSQQYNEQRATLLNERSGYVSELNNANQTISTLMNLTEQDFTNTLNAYNSEYTRNYQAYQLYNTEQNKDKADASANLSTITTMMNSSGKTWADLTPDMQSHIGQLETQAGLPSGTIKSFMSSKPGAKLQTTVNGYDASGNGITSLIYTDANGNPKVTTVHNGTHQKATTSSGITGSGSVGAETDPAKMTPTQLTADYNVSIDNLKDVIRVKSSDTEATLPNGKDATRENAVDYIFTYYKGRIPKSQIQSDLYATYPDNYHDAGYRPKIKK